MRAGGYVAITIAWLGVAAPAWGWGAPERVVKGTVGCVSAPHGGGGIAAWTGRAGTSIADLGARSRPRRLPGTPSCLRLSPDGTLGVDHDEDNERMAAVDVPGGQRTTLASTSAGLPDVATGGGAATIVWDERPEGEPARIVAATRLPGGGFDRGQELASAPFAEGGGDEPQAVVAMDDGGAATVLWTLSSGVASSRREPGGSFGPPHALSPREDRVALAMTRDGRALAAWANFEEPFGTRLAAAVAPAGGPFGAPVALEPAGTSPVAVAGPDGTLLLAWEADGAVWIWPGGGAPQRVATARGVDDLSAAVAQDGRVTVAWGEHSSGLVAAVGRPGGRFTVARQLSSPCRDAIGVYAGFDAAGRGAIAFLPFGYSELGRDTGLDGLFVVRESAPPAPRPAPRAAMRALRTGRLVRVRVDCSGGCDVRATLLRGREFVDQADGRRTITMRAAGHADRVAVTACGDDGGVLRRTIRIRR